MWSGPWIPALPSFKVRPKYDNVDFNEHPLVADLIAGNERNLDLLIELFAANPVDNIMKFSVENPNCQDRLFGSKQRPGVIPLKVTIVRIRALDLVKAKRNSGKKKLWNFKLHERRKLLFIENGVRLLPLGTRFWLVAALHVRQSPMARRTCLGTTHLLESLGGNLNGMLHAVVLPDGMVIC